MRGWTVGGFAVLLVFGAFQSDFAHGQGSERPCYLGQCQEQPSCFFEEDCERKTEPKPEPPNPPKQDPNPPSSSTPKPSSSPPSRFTDSDDGTVTDNKTKLVWLKNANCWNDPQTWNDAMSLVQQLAAGSCSLSDSSTAGQWRLPSLADLKTLLPLPDNLPFTGIQSDSYWSSTKDTRAFSLDNYMVIVNLDSEIVEADSKTETFYVWPVRGKGRSRRLPAGAQVSNCSCYSTPPTSPAVEPKCESGFAKVYVCPNVCPPNHGYFLVCEAVPR